MTPASSESLSHAKGEGQDPVVFLPKGRKQTRYGQSRGVLGPGWRALAGQRGSTLVAGPMGQAHVPRLIRMPPEEAVARVLGSLKGKRAIAVARQCGGRPRHVPGERCWARGSAVSTVAFEEAQMRASSKPQEQRDAQGADASGACEHRDS